MSPGIVEPSKNLHWPPARLYLPNHTPLVSELSKICSRVTEKDECPLAYSVDQNIPIYDALTLQMSDSRLLDEWHHVLLSGAGVFVLKNMYQDRCLIDRTNEAFTKIISRERPNNKGDHFSAGQNDRIWNSFSKHCLEDPRSFVEYYSNPWLARVCEAWLGPCYRITAQTNIVKPGSPAQISHRDYHLGFQTEDACSKFPKSIQIASQLLTLQGAIAHTNMPLQSGPTRFLPFSQTMEDGFLAYRRSEFIEFFLGNYVALPLEAGDAVFFNPALMHAAGSNETSNQNRSANLIQVSSAFGKPMESVDSTELVDGCWSYVQSLFQNEGWSASTNAVVCALGEGYPFPTNLDRRPPAIGGMAPQSEQDVLRRALENKWSRAEVLRTLRQIKEDSAA